jgi:glycosyltransferase involved in cell wall biosynthesis
MVLLFWHNLISPHQAPFMRELADAGHEVLVVATEEMSEERRSLGWEIPSLGRARVILGPDHGKVRQIVESSGPDAVHLIAGARVTSLGRQVALACRASGRRMGIITESPDPRGVRGPLRWAKYSWERITTGRHFDFILAMGPRGVRWFKLCGYPEARIFPFAYVTDRLSGCLGGKPGNAFRFLFVGQLIPRKGVDLLLRALVRVPHCELSVIGDGPERECLQNLARACGTEDRVFWPGKMDAARVQGHILDADMLVLPSREDGWGAVVNESLMAGTPVICSTACGAADLIRQPWLGSVFQSGSVPDLASSLSGWANKGKRNTAERERIRIWARCIEAPSIAGYVEKVLEHVHNHGPRPQAPWRDHSS